MKTLAHALRSHPYLLATLTLGVSLAWGLARLAAMLEAMR